MRVAVHQPEHLPWLGYFAKISAADLLIHLDDVQFEKNYFQNRNRIVDSTGVVHWLTVSARLPAGHRTLLKDALVGDRDSWLVPYINKLRHCLGKAQHFDQVFRWLLPLLESEATLVTLNRRLIEDVARWMCVPAQLGLASDFGVNSTKSERLVDLLKCCSATEYLIGRGSLQYLDFSLFRRAAIDVVLVQYDPVDNVSGQGLPLSVLQLLCEAGFDGIEAPRYSLSRLSD